MKLMVFSAAALLYLAFFCPGGSAQERSINPEIGAAVPASGGGDESSESTGDRNVPEMVVKEGPIQGGAAQTATKGGKAVRAGQTGTVSLDSATGDPKLDKLVLDSAARNGVDPGLIVEVMRQESGFNAHARSYKGACGLMQLMPGTARRFGATNIFDPAQNIEAGAQYLRFLLDKFDGNVDLALAGYNAGEQAVVEAGYRVPRYRETQAYVHNISARYGNAGQQHPAKPETPTPPSAMVMSSGPGDTLSNNY